MGEYPDRRADQRPACRTTPGPVDEVPLELVVLGRSLVHSSENQLPEPEDCYQARGEVNAYHFQLVEYGNDLIVAKGKRSHDQGADGEPENRLVDAFV